MFFLGVQIPVKAESTRAERRLINKGNSLYNEHKFVEAAQVYEEALNVNNASAEARYNYALAKTRQIVNPQDTTPQNKILIDEAKKNFEKVASMARSKPGLAAKANYNLGNLEFNSKDYAKAIEYYKQALRIDPNDDRARKNLRIAQKNLQNQNQDQNKNQQDQNKDKKDQDQNKNNDQNQDNNSKDNNQPKENQPQENNKDLSQQAASQILQAIDNKEAATRARVNKANSGKEAATGQTNYKKW